MDNEMVIEKQWEEFQKTGLFWLINSILHVFGWAIVYEWCPEDGTQIKRVFPARVKFRGFSENNQEEAHKMIARYMADNAGELKEEAEL